MCCPFVARTERRGKRAVLRRGGDRARVGEGNGASEVFAGEVGGLGGLDEDADASAGIERGLGAGERRRGLAWSVHCRRKSMGKSPEHKVLMFGAVDPSPLLTVNDVNQLVIWYRCKSNKRLFKSSCLSV